MRIVPATFTAAGLALMLAALARAQVVDVAADTEKVTNYSATNRLAGAASVALGKTEAGMPVIYVVLKPDVPITDKLLRPGAPSPFCATDAQSPACKIGGEVCDGLKGLGLSYNYDVQLFANGAIVDVMDCEHRHNDSIAVAPPSIPQTDINIVGAYQEANRFGQFAAPYAPAFHWDYAQLEAPPTLDIDVIPKPGVDPAAIARQACRDLNGKLSQAYTLRALINARVMATCRLVPR